jgi:hypothetical protein
MTYRAWNLDPTSPNEREPHRLSAHQANYWPLEQPQQERQELEQVS